MGLYVPFMADWELNNLLFDAIYDPYANGLDFTRKVVDIIDAAVNVGVNSATSYTSGAINLLRESVDHELNWGFDNYDAIIAIRMEAMDAKIGQVQAMIDEIETGAGGPAEQEVIDAYDSIAETHENVSGYLESTLETVSSAMGSMYEFVGESVNKAVQSVDTNLITAITAIINLPQTLIDNAITNLLPVLSLEAVANANKVLFSEPMGGFVASIFSSLTGAIRDLFEISDKDIEKWTGKGVDMMSQITASMMKGEKTPLKFMK